MSPTDPTDADRDRVKALLGREPQGDYSIVVRDEHGDPVVLQNAPLLDDGTPMPTRYWLVGTAEHRRIGQLESSGGVNAAEAAIDPDVLAAAHQRYADERDQALPDGYDGPVPSGGVGGTRVGVKCLHAHWAWYLAGGDDPVGVWIAEQLADPDTESRDRADLVPAGDRFVVGATTTEVVLTSLASTATPRPTATLPWGSTNLTQHWLSDDDPPHPADLTNALGAVDDELDELERAAPGWTARDIVFEGPGVTALVGLELGTDTVPPMVTIDRPTVEELFRLTATATSKERADNPGLPANFAHEIVAVCCIVLAVMRRYQLASAVFVADAPTPADPTSVS